MRKYIISETASVRDALVAINSIIHDGESLIAVNADQQMIGSLTDGDIRRSLISGAELTDPVNNPPANGRVRRRNTGGCHRPAQGNPRQNRRSSPDTRASGA